MSFAAAASEDPTGGRNCGGRGEKLYSARRENPRRGESNSENADVLSLAAAGPEPGSRATYGRKI
jgi:hypothetical protein